MPNGYIQVFAYTSYAQLPLKDVAITITAPDGTAVAMRLTDRNGQIQPIALPAPPLDAGQTPNTGTVPYGTFQLTAQKEGYEQIPIENLQLFPDTTTRQNLEMIPLSELPDQWSKAEFFDTSSQNL